MREEYDSRRRTSTCNKAKECIGKEGDKNEDKTCNQAPECARYMDNRCEILRDKERSLYEALGLFLCSFMLPI